MPRKLSNDQVDERLASRGITLAGEFRGVETKARFRCPKGHEWESLPSSIFQGSGCPKCAGNTLLSRDSVNEKIAKRGIQLEGPYVGALAKARFRCANGHEWDSTPHNVMRGSGCPDCYGNNPLSREKVAQELAGKGFELAGEYRGNTKKTLIRCSQGHTWEATPRSLRVGSGCPYCYGNNPLSREIVNDRIARRGITLSGKFVNVMTKSPFRCAKGHEWKAIPDSVMRGRGCPTCAEPGFDPNAPAVLYYLRVQTRYGEWWKVGITNHSVRKRFQGDLRYITVIREWQFAKGEDAYAVEQEILKECSADLDRRATPLSQGGNSELFKFDVLSLDDLPRKLD